MTSQNRDRLGLTILVIVVVAAVLFVNPFFRYSCSRVMVHDFLGVGHDHMTTSPLFVGNGLVFGVPLLVMLLLWGALSLWVYFDAERRGHSGLLWGLFVFFGNIIGLLIYLIVRTTSPEPVFGAFAGRASQCPNCSERVKSDYIACPRCGASLAKTCAGCGRRVEMDWKVCPHCGKSA